MSYPGHPAGLRISIGTDGEIDRLLEILTKLDRAPAAPMR